MNDLKKRRNSDASNVQSLDAIVVGAGFAGIYALYRLRDLGISVKCFEGARGVGGTWWWNRYPGARVDFPSAPYYGYSFSKELLDEFDWEERQPSQEEVLRYLNFAADKLDVKKDIQFETWIEHAEFDEQSSRWEITTHTGERYSTQFLICAMGSLSDTNKPDIPGIDDFAGEALHTGKWPEEGVDFSGKRVGVIGTGSSGIQSVPVIAEQAEHLTVFQRTPQYSIPAGNRPVQQSELDDARENWDQRKAFMEVTPGGMPYPLPTRSALDDSPEVRTALYEKMWNDGDGLHILYNAYTDLLTNKDANETLAEFIRGKIKEIVKDEDTARKLMPDYILGTKRQVIDCGYFECYNRDNVSLVDLREDPIEKITPTGIVTKDGEHPIDILVLATGFDAITGKLLKLNPVGRDGLDLSTAWKEKFYTYLGVTIPGFPNLFMVHGPQSPCVLFNMPLGGERLGDWIHDCIQHMRDNDISTIEATAGSDEGWAENVEAAAKRTLFHGTDSWYSGANIAGKHRQFIVHTGGQRFFSQINEVAENGYEGFTLEPDPNEQEKKEARSGG
ncbi:MAG: flavin-containing monooxygenase [Gammaproteobacteria bacterium]